MRTLLLLRLVGFGTAISPAAYHQAVEVCRTRARALRLQDGFIRSCVDEARVRRILVSQTAQEDFRINFVCSYRAMSDLFSGGHAIPGTICDDPLLNSDIDPDCRYVLAAHMLPISRLSAPSVDGVFVSLALTRLVSVHESGFAVRMEDLRVRFDNAGILHLNSELLLSLRLPSGQLASGAMRQVKADLEKFHEGLEELFKDESLVRDFGNWIRRIRIDRTSIPLASEYAEWISRFANSDGKKRKALEDPIRKSLLRTRENLDFLPRLAFCQERLQRARSNEPIVEGDEFTLLGSDEIISIGNLILGGDNADVFLTSDSSMIVKRVYSRSEFCRELAALSVLKGLGGRVPELIDVINPIGRMMVMRKVGTTDWPSSEDPRRPSNEHLAQVIEIVRDLHEAGFLHRDLHPGNVRMDPERVYLIDFGKIRPIFINGGDPEKTRRTDMIKLSESVITPDVPGGLRMLADMDSLLDDERPDYEKWISFFRSSL